MLRDIQCFVSEDVYFQSKVEILVCWLLVVGVHSSLAHKKVAYKKVNTCTGQKSKKVEHTWYNLNA